MELSYKEVETLTQIAGLKIDNDDLIEVTHRLNIMISDMEKLSHEDLDIVDPAPFCQFRRTNNGV